MNIKYGSQKSTTILDDNQSTKSVERVYFDERNTKTITEYKIRVRVRNQTEELAEIVRFRKEHPGNDNTWIEFDQSNHSKDQGYYYVVKCWRERE